MLKPPSVLCYAVLGEDEAEQARALFGRLKTLHPDWRFVAVITDGAQDLALGDVEIVTLAELDLDDPQAARAVFLDRACAAAMAPVVAHIDPRAVVTGLLDVLLRPLADHDLLLLARITDPAADREAIEARDLHVARTGTFNIGFLAVRTSGEGPVFAAWWADRVRNYANEAAPPAYRDQRWCDLAPGLFDRVAILRQIPPGLALPIDR